VIAGTSAELLALHPWTNAGHNKMPLLFYFPLITWMGLVEIVQEEMRIPVKVKAGTLERR
jgi:hypothetical protein